MLINSGQYAGMGAAISANAVIGLIAVIFTVVSIIYLIKGGRKFRASKTIESLSERKMSFSLARHMMLISIIGICAGGALLYAVLPSDMLRQIQGSSNPTGMVYLCDYPADDFTYSVSGQTVTLQFLTPVNKSWGFDFGDGSHSKDILLTLDSKQYTVEHTYKKSGTYAVMFLTADVHNQCDTRSTHAVEIP